MTHQPAQHPHPAPPKRGLAGWGHFVHLLARFYMDYYAAVLKAAKRKIGRAVDIDVQVSKSGTPWALHWPTVGGNHLHDPQGRIRSSARIADLTDEEIGRLRSATGRKPWRLAALLYLAAGHRVRVEAELKTHVDRQQIHDLLMDPVIAAMNARGDLQWKTLAHIPGAIHRLRAAHEAGGVTLLTFTNYKEAGIDATLAWPVTDYVRGQAKWVHVPK